MRAAALHKTHSCGICGEKLLRSEKWFVGGSGDVLGLRRGFSDPPMHEECATFALRTCPYLSAPVYVKQIERPDVFTVIMTSSYKYGEKLYRHKDPKPEDRKPGRYPVYYARKPWLRVTWWRAGQELTDPDEILRNIDEIHRHFVAQFLGVDFQEAPPPR